MTKAKGIPGVSRTRSLIASLVIFVMSTATFIGCFQIRMSYLSRPVVSTGQEFFGTPGSEYMLTLEIPKTAYVGFEFLDSKATMLYDQFGQQAWWHWAILTAPDGTETYQAKFDVYLDLMRWDSQGTFTEILTVSGDNPSFKIDASDEVTLEVQIIGRTLDEAINKTAIMAFSLAAFVYLTLTVIEMLLRHKRLGIA